MEKLIQKIKNEMDSFSLTPKTLFELISEIQKLQKEKSPLVKGICEDDFEVLKLSRLLISKLLTEADNKFIQITGDDWRKENIQISLIRFWIDDLGIKRIIAYKIMGLGGHVGFEVVKRRNFLLFIYDEIKTVFHHMGIKFEPLQLKLPLLYNLDFQIKEKRRGWIENSLSAFKKFVERDGWKAFWINGSVKYRNTKKSPEEIGRSQFLAFLRGHEIEYEIKNHIVREVPEGAGFCDVIVFDHFGDKLAFELKMWDGKKYFQTGLIQLDDYLKHESLEEGYYIVFDTRIRDKKIINTPITTTNGRTIHIIQIDIAQIPPTRR